MHDFGDTILGNTPLVMQHDIDMGSIPLIFAVVALIIHIAFAVGVYKDALACRRAKKHLWFVGPIFWAGATLVGSVFVAVIYWGMHHSNLNSDEVPPKTKPDEV